MEKENQKSSNKPKKQVNYTKLFAVQSDLEQILKKACPNISHRSGIYFLIREDIEKNEKFIYLGKGVDLCRRMIFHLQNYEQHIDFSLKKRGFYSQENLGGWKLNVLEFSESELDEKERYYIDLYKNAGYILLNIESGGTNGKTDINERKLGKGYYDGLKQGFRNAQREVAHWFDKSLTYDIKGKPNKNKEKAMAKFKEFIKIEKEEKGEDNG